MGAGGTRTTWTCGGCEQQGSAGRMGRAVARSRLALHPQKAAAFSTLLLCLGQS